MIRVQVVYGRYTALDTVCKRCGGTGTEHGAFACVFCGGSGVVVENLGRPYTYLAPDSTKLWDVMLADAGGTTKHVTVVSLTSQYDGPCKEAYPLPRPEFPCMGECGQMLKGDGNNRMPVLCAGCSAILPEDIRVRLDGATGSGIFAAMVEVKIFLEAYRAGREDEAQEQEALRTPDPWREDAMRWHEESTAWADPWPER